MYDDVLVPTDGSEAAERAVARAVDLARTAAATVHALTVVRADLAPASLDDDAAADVRETAERAGRTAAGRVLERATEFDLTTVHAAREGVPYRAILEYAASEGIDLVVMGSRGRTAGEGLGATTQRVVALADVPVLVVPPEDDFTPSADGYGAYDHVLVPTDGSEAAERAADHAIRIAERYGADVHAVYVVNTDVYEFGDAPRSVVGLLKEGGGGAVEAVAAAARERGLPVTTDVVRGVPHEEIRSYAAGVDADLIAVGTRGRAAGDDPILGSTTARVIARSDVPVLTVT